MKNILTREASPKDAAALASLLGELQYPSDVTQVLQRLERLKLVPGARTFLASSGSEIVGAATVHELVALHTDHKLSQLTLLVVSEGARRQGVGRQLVAAAENWARERGCVRMLVATGEERTEAQSFYSSLGYKHTARRYSKWLTDEKPA